MEVDNNLGSLLENLKVEDPWLPPKSWESIPSENAHRHRRHSHSLSNAPGSSSPTQQQQPLYPTSSISEESLVRLALNSLQGVQSALLSIEKLSAAFCSDPADRSYLQNSNLWNRSSSTHVIGKILKSIGCLGFLVFLIRKFVDNFVFMDYETYSAEKRFDSSESAPNQSHCDSDVQKEHSPPYSLVNQAFAVTVRKVLDGYICALDTLSASVCLRRSSKGVDVPSHTSYGVDCLTSVVHPEVTLLEVYLHTSDLRTKIEALGNICNLNEIALCFSVSSFEELIAKATREFSKFPREGDLLSYLYNQLRVADPAHCTLLKFLFLRTCEPYCGFIKSWIFKAEISDPYKEFVVECVDNMPSYLDRKAGIPNDVPLAIIRDGVAVPCFLKDLLIPLVRAGQQLQVLKKLLELCDWVGPDDCNYEDFLPYWSEHLSNQLFCASSLAFSKRCLHTMVINRSSYYSNMLENLENLLTKLEVKHQQVVSHGAAIVSFDNIGGSSKTSATISWDERLICPSTADKQGSKVAVDNVISDCSTIEGEFYGLGTCVSSECSSLTDSEDQTESELLIEHPISLVRDQRRYFSSVKFCTHSFIDTELEKHIQTQILPDAERYLREKYDETDAIGSCLHSSHTKGILDYMFVLVGSAEPEYSCIYSNSCTDNPTDAHWPRYLPNKHYNDFEGYRYYISSHEFSSAREVGISNLGTLDERLTYFSKMATARAGLTAEVWSKNQLVDCNHTSSLFKTQQQKFNDNNFLSIHPMLKRNGCFHMLSRPEERFRTTCRQPLTCVDFSTVEDPCKVTIEKLSARLRHDLGSQVLPGMTAAASSGEACDEGKQGCGGDDGLIDDSGASYIQSPLDSEENDQEEVSTNVYGGRHWERLLGGFGYVENRSDRDNKDDLSSTFEIPLDFVIDKCLLQGILLQYKYVSKFAIKLLEEGFHLQEHLLALRRYYFMESADWADYFIMSLWHHNWCATEAYQRVSEIQSFLELSVQRSSCEWDPYKDRLFVYVKGDGIIPLSTSAVGVHSFDFLGLGYRVDWPISIVLTHGTFKIYAEIFSFLIRVKLSVFSLTDVWRSLKDVMPLIWENHHSMIHGQESAHFHMLVKLWHQVNHFISTLRQYVQSQLSHLSWCRFLHSLNYKVRDIMDLESVHMAYLTDSLQICFLSNETQTIAGIIENILQCALEFRSCLNSSSWDVTTDQTDLQGKFWRINLPQVLIIKQKFDKSLKELHLCYLKSPKHGEFGIFHFWAYLNYNDYYSDIVNVMDLSVF